MYARAIFQAAQDEGRLDEVAADLAALAGALEESPELRAFLRNPQIDALEKARVLGEVAAGADELVLNFLRLLAEKGRAGELVETNAELEALVARAQNRLAVELTTAHELSDDEAQLDRRADREGFRPHGRSDALRRSQPRRGTRPPGRLLPRRRQRARPPRAPPPRACHLPLAH